MTASPLTKALAHSQWSIKLQKCRKWWHNFDFFFANFDDFQNSVCDFEELDKYFLQLFKIFDWNWLTEYFLCHLIISSNSFNTISICFHKISMKHLQIRKESWFFFRKRWKLLLLRIPMSSYRFVLIRNDK